MSLGTAPNFHASFRQTGTVRSVAPKQGVLQKAVGSGSSSAPDTVLSFLKLQQPIFGLREPQRELRLRKTHKDHLGHTHLRFSQLHQGVPVFGAELVAQLDEQGNLITINGAYTSTPKKLVTIPTVTSQQASSSVRASFNQIEWMSAPELVIFSEDRRNSHLAWKFVVDVSPIESHLVLRDAHDGSELLSLNQVQTGQASGQGDDLFGQTHQFASSLWEEGGNYYMVDTTKNMYDPTSVPPQPVSSRGVIFIGDANNTTDQVLFVGSTTGPDGPWLPDGVSAAVNLSATYDYFFERHGRNSLDDSGGNLLGIVRVGEQLQNAFFNGSTQTMYFGDAEPYAGAFDVVAHEMTHGVISTAIPGGLIYFGQSGALNESFADIFAEMAEAYHKGTTPDWIIGSQLSQPMRSMSDPGSLEFAPGHPYPSRMSEFVGPNDPVLNLFQDKDNNGVHINSSIINHAFYLLTAAATNTISREDAESIFYRALTTKLSALSDFIDMRIAAIQSAEELFGNGSFQAQATAEAFDSVEIFDAPTNPLPPPTPSIPASDATLFVYWDGVNGAYYLGRLEPGLDSPPGIQLSLNPVSPRPPSVSGDGTFAVFVDAQNDVCLIATNGAAPETCLGFPGQIASVAVAPDGETFGLVYLEGGQPSNVIGVIDIASEEEETYVLVAPAPDGTSNINVMNADALDFTSDNRFLIYDAFNAMNFDDGSVLGLWSIYAIDRSTDSTIALTVPTPGINTAYPNVAQTSDAHVVFDVLNIPAGSNDIVALNVYTGEAAIVTTTGPFFTAPVYLGDDTSIVYSDEDPAEPTFSSLWQAPLQEDRVTPSGAPQEWLADAAAGAIYRRGTPQSVGNVDITVDYSGSTSQQPHGARFDLELANVGDDEATDVSLSVSLPSNVIVDTVENSGIPTCTVFADRIDCEIGSIQSGESELVGFELTLTSFSSTAQVVSSATAFAGQPDQNSQDNTSLASVDEMDLNSAPELLSSLINRTETEGVASNFSIAGNFEDADGDDLTFSATGLPGSMSINAGSGSITGTPTAAEAGNAYTVTVTAADSFGDAESDSFTITINAAPPPPPPPQSSGGGGGSIGVVFLLALLSNVFCRRRPRRQMGRRVHRLSGPNPARFPLPRYFAYQSR